MNRKKSMICNVDVSKLKATEKTLVLTQIINSELEADCLTPDLYIDKEDVKDSFLAFVKDGKATCKSGFPKRYTEDANGSIVDKDGKKWSKLTAGNLKDAKVIKQKIDMPVDKLN